MTPDSRDQSPRAPTGGAGARPDAADLAEMRARLAWAGVTFGDDDLAAVLPAVWKRVTGLRRLADALTPEDGPATDSLRADLR